MVSLSSDINLVPWAVWASIPTRELRGVNVVELLEFATPLIVAKVTVETKVSCLG